MKYLTRKWIKPEDLNPNGSLFGGSLLKWIDEEAAIYTITMLQSPYVVTKLMSEINFVSSARAGDVLEMGMKIAKLGRSSITLKCEVRNIMTRHTIVKIDKIVFVNLDSSGLPSPHGKKLADFSEEDV
ncbi:MAG: hotdog domain-containing protein [Verrucomicrobiales bacterium]|nr:hotdog domain-containing protein [Verrucomicrobiales bacterium]